MSSVILTVKNLKIMHQNFNFRGHPSFLLKDINFTLPKNRSISIVGESGSGKTTLMKTLLGIHSIKSGRVLFYDTDIGKINSKEKKNYRRSIQPVFQNYRQSFNPLITLRKSLLIGFNQKMSPSGKVKFLHENLNLVELPIDIIHKYPHQVSGGELQRLAFVRALTTQPQILVLDEPFSSLDIINEQKLLEIILNIQKTYQLSIIFITHKLPLVQYFNDQVHKITNNQFSRWSKYEQ